MDSIEPTAAWHVRKQTILRNADPGIITRAFRSRHVRVIRGQIASSLNGQRSKIDPGRACAALEKSALWILLFTVQSVTKTDALAAMRS